MTKKLKRYLLSTSIVPAGFAGIVRVAEIGVAEALDLLEEGYTSAVGHAATAEALTTLLGIPVEANRITVEVPKEGCIFVAFQLKTRPPEGTILTLAELENIGYSLRYMEFVPGPG